jgi:hypothetical protein
MLIAHTNFNLNFAHCLSHYLRDCIFIYYQGEEGSEGRGYSWI